MICIDLDELCSRQQYVYRQSEIGRFGCNFLSQLGTENGQKVWSRYTGMYVLRGTGWYEDWNGKRWEVGPGSFPQHLPGRWHTIHRDAGSGWCEFSIGMEQDLFEHLAGLHCIEPDTPVLFPGLSQKLIHDADRIFQHMQQCPAARLVSAFIDIQRLLRDIIDVSCRSDAPKRHEALIEEAMDIIAINTTNPIDLEEIARGLGLSYSHFRRLFREHTGVAPGKYRILKRLENAENLLQQDELSIQAIAAALGYSDAFIFSKQFRKYKGVSPRDYRSSQAFGF